MPFTNPLVFLGKGASHSKVPHTVCQVGVTYLTVVRTCEPPCMCTLLFKQIFSLFVLFQPSFLYKG